MPPACETAATSSGLEHGYMAPPISGTSIPASRVRGVSRDPGAPGLAPGVSVPGVRGSPGAGAEVLPAEQVALGEEDRRIELEVLVALLAEAVAFVLGHEVPDGHAALLQGGHHLLGLGPRDARVVHPLDDEEGLGHLVHV